ncbi:TPA: hypothetical protein HA265_02835, partial [Candidatus Woesearchaeota archaeon]|nr:hypothetical protein [Candidatus Woesearchaeota archaeon]
MYEYKKEKRVEQFSAALKGTNKIVKTDDYELNFSGEDEDLNVTVGGLDENIEYPENEHLKIVGKPIVLNVTRTDVTEDEDAEQSTSMRITMPYILEEGDDPESVALYAMIKEGEETRWEFIGGKSDIILGLVEAEIDLNRYEQDGKVTIAP